jgi:hypothetical protein
LGIMPPVMSSHQDGFGEGTAIEKTGGPEKPDCEECVF